MKKTTQTEERDRLLKWLAVCVIGMAAFQAATVPTGTLMWDYVVHVNKTRALIAVFLTVGAFAFMLGADVLLWRLNSLTGDHDAGNYWLYCAVMSALCWLFSDLDSGGGITVLIAALFSTPLGPVGILLAVLDGARHEFCCAVCLAFCLVRAGYYQRLHRRHVAVRQP